MLNIFSKFLDINQREIDRLRKIVDKVNDHEKEVKKLKDKDFIKKTEEFKARIEKGLTQADIAKRMKTKQSVISRAENAKTVPSLSFLKRLARVLGLSLQVQFKPQ